MKKLLSLTLIFAVFFVQVACHSKPKAKPLTEYSDEELVYYYKNAPVEKPKDPGYDWSNLLSDTAHVIVMLPVWVALLFTSDSAVKSDQAQKKDPGI